MIFKRCNYTSPIILWLLVVSFCMRPVHATTEEDQLFKAAFIYNFAKFTHWPDDAWQKQTQTIELCAIGQDKLTDKLLTLNEQLLRDRVLKVRKTGLVEVTDCHIIYISLSHKTKYRGLLTKLQDKPVLTVAQFNGFAKSGGIIELHNKGGQTEIIINLQSANRANISLSSRLLILANIIDQDN